MTDLQKIKKVVMVDIAWTQRFEGLEPFTVQEEALGSLYQIDPATHIIAFDTIINERKITNTLKLQNNILSIVNLGEVHTRQTFALGEWYASQYWYGGDSLTCRNFTKQLDYALNAEGGFIDLSYQLWNRDTMLGWYDYELFIR